MNGHPIIVTKFDRWAEQIRRVVKGTQVRGQNVVTEEVNHWNKGLGIWSMQPALEREHGQHAHLGRTASSATRSPD